MRIQERMVVRLKTVTAFGGRVFPAVKPQRVKDWPCAIYLSVGGGPVEALEGAAPRPAYRVDVLAKGYGEGAVLAANVAAAMEPLLAEAPSWPTEIFDEEAEVFRFSTTFVLRG